MIQFVQRTGDLLKAKELLVLLSTGEDTSNEYQYLDLELDNRGSFYAFRLVSKCSNQGIIPDEHDYKQVSSFPLTDYPLHQLQSICGVFNVNVAEVAFLINRPVGTFSIFSMNVIVMDTGPDSNSMKNKMETVIDTFDIGICKVAFSQDSLYAGNVYSNDMKEGSSERTLTIIEAQSLIDGQPLSVEEKLEKLSAVNIPIELSAVKYTSGQYTHLSIYSKEAAIRIVQNALNKDMHRVQKYVGRYFSLDKVLDSTTMSLDGIVTNCETIRPYVVDSCIFFAVLHVCKDKRCFSHYTRMKNALNYLTCPHGFAGTPEFTSITIAEYLLIRSICILIELNTENEANFDTVHPYVAVIPTIQCEHGSR